MYIYVQKINCNEIDLLDIGCICEYFEGMIVVMELKDSETYKNLMRTFAGESRARNMYNLFGEKADKEGYLWIKKIFDETALNEYAHAREVFKRYLCFVGTTEENLKKAVEGESEETECIYKKFEETAKKEGFEDIADFYADLQEVEESHKKRFSELYKKLKDERLHKSDDEVMWRCMNCGYIYVGKEAPNECPLCHYPRKFFKRYCSDSCKKKAE